MRLKVTRLAEREIRSARDWWHENRSGSMGLFHKELNRAFEVILAHPRIGALATNMEMPGVRRLLLQRCRYFLYYRVESNAVEILALWHTSRGDEPPLNLRAP